MVIFLGLVMALVVISIYFVVRVITSKQKIVSKRLDDIQDDNQNTRGMFGDNAAEVHKTDHSLSRRIPVSERLADDISVLNLKISPNQFVFFWGAALIGLPILGKLVGMNPLLQATVIAVVLFVPFILISYKKQKRQQVFGRQLPIALDSMCGTLKAGYSVQNAFELIGEESDAPLGEEFSKVYKEINYGKPMSDALKDMAARMDSKSVLLLDTAIAVQSRVGGNLIEILQSLSATIRTNQELEEEIKSKTASARLSGIIVAILPIVLLVVLNIMNPEYCEMFFTTKKGMIMLGMAGAMELFGYLMIRKITTIKF